MEAYNFNREDLYTLLWSKPLASVATECGVSVPVLRQLCLDQAIPLPWGGYKPENESKRRLPLPPVGLDFDLKDAIASAIDSLHFSGETSASFIIERKLTAPDPLVIAAQNTIRQDYQLYGMPHMLRADFGQLALRSSRINLNRALRIMDTLVKAWRRRGYRIINQDKETSVYVRDVSMRISLRETTTIQPPKEKYGRQTHTSTGHLAFKVNGWLGREWKDGKVPVETRIQEIVDHMEVAARELEKIWAERRAEERIEAQERQVQAALIQQDIEEKAAFEALMQEAQRWEQFQTLDKYLDVLSQNAEKTPAFEQWLKWARHRRQLFDPYRERKDKIQ